MRAGASPPAPVFPARLETPRLLLQPVRVEHAGLLHDLWNQPAVRASLWRGHALSPEQSREMAARSEWLHAQRGQGLWVAHARDGGELAGFGGYWQMGEGEPPELMYALQRALWGQGLATEMVQALVGYGWSVLQLPELRASTEPDNLPSVRLLRRLGFTSGRGGGALQTWRLLPSPVDDSWGT